MFRKALILTISVILTFSLATTGYFLFKNTYEKIEFADTAVEYEVRLLLKNERKSLTRQNLEKITVLDLQDKEVTSLQGVEYLKNLRILNLSGNDITDFSPLNNLNFLDTLDISNTKTIDLRAKGLLDINLPSLLNLNLSANSVVEVTDEGTVYKKLEDLGGIGRFDTLISLNLSSNNLTDLVPLRPLFRLQSLDLSLNSLNDTPVETLSEMTSLTSLNLRQNNIFYIDFLSGLTNLTYLNLHSNYNIASLEPISNLTALTKLVLRNVDIGSDIVYLSNLINLQTLNLRNTNIADVSVLASLMQSGALIDRLDLGYQAEIDIRDNPIPNIIDDGVDGYAPIRQYYNNISLKEPLILPQAPTYELFINEIMSSNNLALADIDGDFSDWIELYNPNDRSIDISGYYLSDSRSNLKKWHFPDGTTITEKGYLLIFASGKDKVQDGEIHTNFSISKDGESIILSDTLGRVLDGVGPQYIPQNTSYGRKTDGSLELVYFDIENISPSESNDGKESVVPPKLFAPVFSRNAGFYIESFELEIYGVEGAEIYYTLDGSKPTVDSIKYIAPIPLNSQKISAETEDALMNIESVSPMYWRAPRGEFLKVPIVRAIAVTNYGTSTVTTATFFIDEDIFNMHSFKIMTITTEQDNLFGFEKGIMVAGINYNTSIPEVANDNRTGNFFQRGIEWEREAFVELYEKDGSLAFSQNVGLKIHGNLSRKYPVKSFKLYARNEYDEFNRFNYQFFEDKDIAEFKSILLRGGGQCSLDNRGNIFGDELSQSLLKGMNLDIQYSTPVIIFINGEYFGIKAIRDHYSDHYLAIKYGGEREKFTILESVGAYTEGSTQGVQHYKDLINFISSNDLSITENYNYIQTLMDVENFINYFIAELYFNNVDWPHGNIKFWRYNVDYDENAPYGLDGRWRWLVFDLDAGFSNSWGGMDFNLDPLTRLEGADLPATSTALFFSLLTNIEFRNNFTTRFYDLLNTFFNAERVIGIISNFKAIYNEEMKGHINLYGYPNSFSTWETNVNRNITFTQGRPSVLREHIANYFGLPLENYTVDLEVMGGGEICLNNYTNLTEFITDNRWQGIYNSALEITLTAIDTNDKTFVKWLIDGDEVFGNTLTVNAQADITAVFE